MACKFYIDTYRGISYEVWDEIFSPEFYTEHLQRLICEIHWPPHELMHIVDLRAISFERSLEEDTFIKISGFIRKYSEHFRDLKVAVLITQATIDTGLFRRILEQLPMIVILFTRVDLACLWLGADTEEAELRLQHLHAQFIEGKAIAFVPQESIRTMHNLRIVTSKLDELKLELKEILHKIKDPDTTHEEYMRAVERLGKAWEELIQEMERTKPINPVPGTNKKS